MSKPGDPGYLFHQELIEMDGLYPKYIVYRWPTDSFDDDPQIRASYLADVTVGPEGQGEVWLEMEQPRGFLFVLKPDTDQHARVALAAYAESVRPSDPRLASDLEVVLGQELEL